MTFLAHLSGLCTVVVVYVFSSLASNLSKIFLVIVKILPLFVKIFSVIVKIFLVIVAEEDGTEKGVSVCVVTQG